MNNEKNYSTKITVGARALSKHSDRGKDVMIVFNNQGFWGSCDGSEFERNVKANEIFHKLMNDCVWINIHFLPHSIKILEVNSSIT